MDPALARSFERQLKFIVAKNPRYAWGGSSDLSKGLDCSGYIFLAGKWAGLPGIQRTTSYRMSLGLGGWTGEVSDLSKVSVCNLIFWTFSPGRPNGHVGAIISHDSEHVRVTHASQGRGVVAEPMNSYLIRKTTAVRKLSIAR
jgi:cell wall-associated NlpC family hydrolase